MEQYKYNLSLYSAWFIIHENDLPKHYEYTMRQFIVDHSLKNLLEKESITKNDENNIIRLIDDVADFIKNHLRIINQI